MRHFNPVKLKRARVVDRVLKALSPVLRPLLRPTPVRESVERILVYEAWMLGDFIMAIPAMKFLKKQFPDARIDCICPAAITALESFIPYVDRLIPFTAPWSYQAEGAGSAVDLLRFVRRLRAEKYDWAFDLRGDLRDILFLYLTGASRRAAFDTTGGAYLLSHVVPFLSDRYAHQLEGNMLVVSHPFGAAFSREESVPEMMIPAEWAANAKQWLDERGIDTFVTVHPGTNSRTKAWPADRWAKLLHRDVVPNQHTVVFGTPSERADIQEVMSLMRGSANITYAEVSLPLLCALIAKARFVVTLDSMVGHIASAVGTPVVTIHGYRAPEMCRPYGPKQQSAALPDVPCRTCHRNICTQARNFCILDLPVETVSRAIDRLGV